MIKVAIALAIMGIGSSYSQPAKADNWGCTVVLCLSNPAGPTAVAECVAPINKLYRVLEQGGSFPSCDMGPSSGASMQRVSNRYALCPEGREEASGWVAAADAPSAEWFSGVEKRDMLPKYHPQACVDELVGSYYVPERCVGGDAGDCTPARRVNVYNTIEVLQPKQTSRAFDFYRDGVLHSRHHY